MKTNGYSAEQIIFFVTVLIAGLCSIVYELLISTTSSYFLGDSIKQFSLTIGIYMAAMGVGAYLTQFIPDKLPEWFIRIELLLGVIGGASVPILYFVFDQLSAEHYQWIMLGLTFVIGTLTGCEIPILIRILKTHYPLKSNLAYVLSLDYVGALIATLLFPFFLLPFAGTFRTSIIFGLINILLGWFIYRYFIGQLSLNKRHSLEWAAGLSVVFFLLLGGFSGQLLQHWEDDFYASRIVHSEQTPYQNLVLTKNRSDIRLYINRIIQFSSIDEYRYHEALAHVPINAAPYKEQVLILGGGEGLLAREVLKDPKVKGITVVDLDQRVFDLAKSNPHVLKVNEDALSNPKVRLVAQDAMTFLTESQIKYDLILADLPDPSNESLARLYSTAFFQLVQQRLSAHGVFATQATSPFHTRNAFWCIEESLRTSGFENVYPYHVYVPSFGDWGFVLASGLPLTPKRLTNDKPYRYLDSTIVEQMFYFEKDIAKPADMRPNYMDRPELLSYFLNDWEQWRKEKKH
ncbi:MAG: polyamine aminopropyltransferase [Bacteroidota bacterium]